MVVDPNEIKQQQQYETHGTLRHKSRLTKRQPGDESFIRIIDFGRPSDFDLGKFQCIYIYKYTLNVYVQQCKRNRCRWKKMRKRRKMKKKKKRIGELSERCITHYVADLLFYIFIFVDFHISPSLLPFFSLGFFLRMCYESCSKKKRSFFQSMNERNDNGQIVMMKVVIHLPFSSYLLCHSILSLLFLAFSI